MESKEARPVGAKVTRRSFLAGAGLAGAGAALCLIGCAPKEDSLEASSPSGSETAGAQDAAGAAADSVWALQEVGEPEETISAEVCIVGGGGTGLAAAIQCAQLGLKPLVIEKLGGYGGSFVGTEFINAVGSEQQKATGAEDSVDDIILDHLNYHHYIPRKELVESLYRNAADTIDWLVGFGIDLVAVDGMSMKNRALIYHAPEGSTPGAYVIEKLQVQADNLGVEALFDAQARKIVMEQGSVAGVLVEKKDGTIVKIESKAVLLATGGYSNNEEFLNAVSSNVNENIQALGMDCRHADGIKMAADAGAAMAEGLGTIQWSGPVVKGAITASWQNDGYGAGAQPMLWINQDAKRFVREDLVAENFTYAGISVRNQRRTFTLFTESDMEHWEKVGGYRAVFGFVTEDGPLTEARAILSGSEGCHVHDTLEEAAAAVDLDPQALKDTVERYNVLCEAASQSDPEDTEADADFGKHAKHMRPVKEGPYWLCETANGFFATHGGIKINEKTEVLNGDGEVIAGLYAGGCDAGGIQGDSYDVIYAGGSTSGWAINTGRNAARVIKEFLAS